MFPLVRGFLERMGHSKLLTRCNDEDVFLQKRTVNVAWASVYRDDVIGNAFQEF
jgi:hypothetical protein